MPSSSWEEWVPNRRSLFPEEHLLPAVIIFCLCVHMNVQFYAIFIRGFIYIGIFVHAYRGHEHAFSFLQRKGTSVDRERGVFANPSDRQTSKLHSQGFRKCRIQKRILYEAGYIERRRISGVLIRKDMALNSIEDFLLFIRQTSYIGNKPKGCGHCICLHVTNRETFK